MMADYDRTMELVTAANNSAGASDVQFGKTLESLEAKLNKLSNAWNEFAQGIMNSSILKGAIDVLTAILDTVNKLTGSLGEIPGAIAKILVGFGAIKIGKGIFNSFFSSIGKAFMQGGQNISQQFGEGMQKDLLGKVEPVGIRLKAWAKRCSTDLAKNLKLNNNSVDAIIQTFDKVPKGIQKQFAKTTPSFGKNIVADFKSSINYEGLSEAGRRMADSIEQQFLQEINDGEIVQAINHLQQAIRGEVTSPYVKNYWDARDRAAAKPGEEVKYSSDNQRQYYMRGWNQQKNELVLGQKTVDDLQQSFSTLGDTAGRVGAVFLNFGQTLRGLGLDGLADTIQGIGMALTSVGNTITGIINLISSMGPAGWIGLIIAAVAAAIAIFGDWRSETQKLEDNLENVNKELDRATEAAEKAEESYNNLISSFESYNTAKDALDDLVAGSEAFNKSLQETNEQVLNLLTTFPELAKYKITTDENGLLTISEEDQKQAEREFKEKQIESQNLELGAKIAQSQAQNKLTLSDLKSEMQQDVYDAFVFTDEMVSEIVQLYQENKEAFISQTVTSAEQFNNLSLEVREAMDKAYNLGLGDNFEIDQNTFTTIFGDSAQIFSAELARVTGYSDELAAAVIKNADGIKSTADALDQSKNVFKANLRSILSTKFDFLDYSVAQADVINEGINILTSNVPNYEKQLEDAKSEIKQQLDGKSIKEKYAQTFNVELSSLEDITEDALLESWANFNLSQDFSDRYSKLIQDTLRTQTFDSLENVTNLLDSNLGYNGPIFESTKDADEYITQLAHELGYEAEDYAEALGYTTDELIDAFYENSQNIAERGKEVRNQLAGILTSGKTINSQEEVARAQKAAQILLNVDIEDQEQILNTVTALSERTSAIIANQFAGDVTKLFASGQEQLGQEALSIFSSIDWSTPIGAMKGLSTATKNTNREISSMAASYATLLDYDVGDIVKSFITSEDFTKVKESIDDLIEKNESLTGSSLREIAGESENLQYILDEASVSAEALAIILRDISNGSLSVDDVSYAVINLIDKFSSLDTVIADSLLLIENFDAGPDEGSVGEWVNEAAEAVEEFYQNGEYGNTQLQNYLRLLFGDEAWDTALKEADGNLKEAEKGFVDRLSVLEGNLYGAWYELANDEHYQAQIKKAIEELEYPESLENGFKIYTDEEGQVQLQAAGATTKQLVEILAKAYGVSEDYAKAMLTDFASYSENLRTELTKNDFFSGIDQYVQDKTVTLPTGFQNVIFSDKEISTIAQETGTDELEVYQAIYDTLYNTEQEFKTLEEAKQAFNDKRLLLEVEDKPIETIKEDLRELTGFGQDWYSSFSKTVDGVTQVAVDDLYNFLKGLNIPPETIQALIAELASSTENTEFTVNGIEISDENKELLATDVEQAIQQANVDVIDQEKINKTAHAYAEAFSNLDFEVDTDGAVDNINTLADAFISLGDTGTIKAAEVTTSTEAIGTAADTSKLKVDSLKNKINELTGKDVPITVTFKKSQTGIDIGGKKLAINFYAKGSPKIRDNSVGILGDGNGPELLIGKDGAAVYGQDGPELVNLSKGDRIYTAEETKKILGSATSLRNIPVFRLGNINNNTNIVGYGPPSSQTRGGGSSTGSSKSSSSGRSSGSSSKKEEEKWENPYDWLYNLTEDINEELRTREKLERRYDRILENRKKTGKDLLKNVQDQIKSLETQRKLEQEMYDKRTQEMKKVLKENQKYSDYATFNWKDNTIEINWDKIDKVTDTEKGEAIEDYISKLEDIQKEMDDAEDALDDIIDEIAELNEIGKEEYEDLESRVLDAIIQREQDQIDRLSDVNDAINDTNTKLIDSMRNSIEQQRQARQNEQTETDIGELETRLAYLRQDTSGANQVEILSLEDELAQKRQDYTDSLIDQKINELEAQNEAAVEQRNLQIQLLQSQLDQAIADGKYWPEVQKLISNGIDSKGGLKPNSELKKVLTDIEGFDGMSELQKMDWLAGLEESVKQITVFLSQNRQLEQVGKTSGSITFTNAEGKKLKGTVDKSGNVTVKTDKGTYTYKDVYMDYAGNYHTVEDTPKLVPNKTTQPQPDTSKTQDDSKKKTETKTETKAIKEGTKVKVNKDTLIYRESTATKGWTQYFSYDPRYVVTGVDEKHKRVSVRHISASSGVTGWFNIDDVKAYKLGGLVNSTGPAWLDGTFAKPEMVLNSNDTKNFIELKDILSDLLNRTTTVNSSEKNEGNIYNLHIEVGSVRSDDDISKIASEIKKVIFNDSSYRNVNAINRLR